MLAGVRAFFQRRGVLEAETPVLSYFGDPDPAVEYLSSYRRAPGSGGETTLLLQTSPEFPMKRLLAAGSGSIYQICKVFRAGESGRLHHPEFTMLEWYRVDWDYRQLMDELALLVSELLASRPALKAVEQIAYRDAFVRYAGLDPHQTTLEQLRECAARTGIEASAAIKDSDRDSWLDLLLTRIVEPNLGNGRMTFLYDYPASQAALARVRGGVAQRFELYIDGIELANGFQELSDPIEQERRFEAHRVARKRRGQPPVLTDERLLDALKAGLPACAGVALGVDRLLMLAAGADHINQVLAFPLDRAEPVFGTIEKAQ